MGRVLLNSALTALLASGVSSASTGTADALVLCADPFAATARLGIAAGAVTAGASAGTTNPAALIPGITASGGTARLESSTAGAAAAFSAGGGSTAGLAIQWLGHGGIQGRDEAGMPTGEYSWSTGCLSASFSTAILPGLRAGASLGPVWESADAEGATGLTSTIGLYSDALPGLELGLSVDNLGSAPEWNGVRKNMPTVLTLGASWRPAAILRLVGGGSLGFFTASRLSAAAEIPAGPVAVSGGWELVPGESEASGPFFGAGYAYESSGSYRLDISLSRDEFGWPVLAGLSASF